MKLKNLLPSYTIVVALVVFLGSLGGCDYRTPSTPDENDAEVSYHLDAQVDRTEIYADNGKTVARVTVRLQNDQLEPLAGRAINFAATSGTITSQATTNSSGLATAVFDDKGAVNTEGVQIIARYTDEAQNSTRDTVFVTVRPVTDLVNNIRFTPIDDVMVQNPTASYDVDVQVHVLDDAPSPIANIPVQFQLENQTDPLGTLSASSDTSDANGAASITFSSFPGAVGDVVITAFVDRGDAEAAIAKSGADLDLSGIPKAADAMAFSVTDTIHLVSPGQYSLTLLTSASTIFVDGGITSATIRAVLKDKDDRPVRNASIDFSSSPAIGGEQIGVLASPVQTDSQGVATTVFSDLGDPNRIGVSTIRAVYTHPFFGKMEDSVQVSVELADPGIFTMTLVSSKDTIYVDDGATFSVIRAVMKDDNDQPVKNAQVFFSASGNFGVINSPVRTDSQGVARAVYSDLGDPDRIGTSTIRATYYHPYHGVLSDSVQVTVALRQLSSTPASIALEAENYVLDQGSQTTLIYATVMDSSGNAIRNNIPVFFTLEPVNRGIIDEVAVTDNNGVAVANFSTGSSAGIVRITATVVISADNQVTATTALQINSGVPKYIQIPPANPNKIQVKDGGGIETTILRAELYDSNGQLISNPTNGPYNVEFRIKTPAPEGVNLNNQGLMTVVEASNGIATVTLNAGTEAGNVRIQASVDLGDTTIQATTVPVIIEAGFPEFIFAEWDPSSIIQAGGGIYEMELGAIVRDRYSNPVPDSTQVYWFMANDSMQAHVEGTSFTANENENGDSYAGIAFTKFRWPTRLTFNQVELHARTYGDPGNDSTYVETVVTLTNGDLPLIPFHPGQLSLSASPGAWDFTTDGNPATIGFSVTLTNSYGTPIANAPIQFISDRQPQSWDPDNVVVTDQNGQAQTSAIFPQTICPQIPNTDPAQFETIDVTVFAVLTLPQMTTSNEIILTFSRSFSGALQVQAKEKE